MNSCLLAGLRWLNSSGIQDESGGVSRYYRHQTAQPIEPQPISTAVTGYFIRALLWADRFSGDEPSERARLAGRFLLEQSFDLSREVFPFEHPMGAGPPASLAYFFDCGMTIRGLLQLAKATEDPSYIECAERCGLVLSTRMATVDGGFFALFDIDNDRSFTDSGSWSVQAEVHQLKVGLAFLELFEATGRGEVERPHVRHDHRRAPAGVETQLELAGCGRLRDRAGGHCHGIPLFQRMNVLCIYRGR